MQKGQTLTNFVLIKGVPHYNLEFVKMSGKIKHMASACSHLTKRMQNKDTRHDSSFSTLVTF